MYQRYCDYVGMVTTKRKVFSEVQKRIVAADQKYMCTGPICDGEVLLTSLWELDHIKPLFQGGTNYYNFDNKHDIDNNLQVICPMCHSKKTQRERCGFFSKERRFKYGDTSDTFEFAESFYYQEKSKYF